MKSNIRISLFPLLNLHICLSFVQSLLSQFLSSHGQFSFPFNLDPSVLRGAKSRSDLGRYRPVQKRSRRPPHCLPREVAHTHTRMKILVRIHHSRCSRCEPRPTRHNPRKTGSIWADAPVVDGCVSLLDRAGGVEESQVCLSFWFFCQARLGVVAMRQETLFDTHMGTTAWAALQPSRPLCAKAKQICGREEALLRAVSVCDRATRDIY